MSGFSGAPRLWRGMGVALALAAMVLALPVPLRAQELTGLARVLPEASVLRDSGEGVMLDLALSQPVPWRVRTLSDPPRLLLDFREVDFSLLPVDAIAPSGRVVALRFGTLRPGWSRMVMELDGPYAVSRAAMDTASDAGAAVVRLELEPTGDAEFAAASAPPDDALWDLPAKGGLPAAAPRGEGDFVVVLDPGHGGIDPGAEREGLKEAELMLTFARELREALLRAGGFSVVMTRESDSFVSLEGRVRIAREAGADVFLSLHADALSGGGASGATIYTLADEATDAASAALAERHDRDDLLAGVDLSAQDDRIANVLMSIARNETMPRTDRLADTLVAALEESVGGLHSRPRQAAGFSVLKAPDIPAVLIEVGFMSSPVDLARLSDSDWRGEFADALVVALQRWVLADSAESGLRRR